MINKDYERLIKNISDTTSSIRATINPMQPMIDAVQITSQRMNAMMAGLRPGILDVQNQFTEMTMSANKIAEQMARYFRIPEFVQLHERYEQRMHELDVFIMILSELGWTPALDISVTDIPIWVEEFEREGLEAVREPLAVFLTELYNEEILSAMLNEWEQHPHLQPRMRILRSAVNAHIRGEFELSVPTLIAQVEGFVAAAKGHTGRLKQRTYKQLLLDAADDGKRVSSLIKSFVTKHLLEGFEHGNPIPELSRNAILHGADLEYATVANSLKVILFIDWLRRQLVLKEAV